MKNLNLNYLALILIVLLSYTTSLAQHVSYSKFSYADGDIIFIKNNSEDFTAKSKYTFAGIIFIEDSSPVVYYANKTVNKCLLSEFINLSPTKKYIVKHLIEKEILTDDVITNMHDIAKIKLNMDSKNKATTIQNNTNFVWDIYKSSTGLPLCKTEKSTDLNNTTIASTKTTIAIKDMYLSEFLEE